MKDLAKLNKLYLEHDSQKAALCRIGCQESEVKNRLIKFKKQKSKKEKPVSEFKKYKDLCWKYTNQQDLKSLENYDKRGFFNYHLDHVISIWTGYKKGIEPETIGHISNLKMIPYKENLRKGKHERK